MVSLLRKFRTIIKNEAWWDEQARLRKVPDENGDRWDAGAVFNLLLMYQGVS